MRLLIGAALMLVLWACEAQEVPWSADELKDHQEQMHNAGRAFAVRDLCMPMINEDEDARLRVLLAIEAKRYSQLKEIDTEARRAWLLKHAWNSHGTAEQRASLEASYDASYEATFNEIEADPKPLETCVLTIIDFHNSIINAGAGS